MTNREFFMAVASMENVSVELVNFANESIAKLDKRNETRSSKPSKVSIENEPIKKSILENLTNEMVGASTIAEIVGISTQKASSLLKQLVTEEKIVSKDIKVTKYDKEGHKSTRTCKGYALKEE